MMSKLAGSSQDPEDIIPPAPACIVAATSAVQSLGSMGILILPAIAPQAAEGIGVSSALIGMQMSLVFGVAALSSLFGARLVRRLGGVRVSQLSLCLVAAGLAFAALSSVGFVALGSVLMGLGYAMPSPAAADLLIRFTPPARRNLVFSLKQTGVPIGGALAGLCAPALAYLYGWQAPLLATAAAALLLVFILQRVRGDWDRDRDPHFTIGKLPRGLLTMLATVPALRYFCGTGLLLAGIQFSMTTYLVVLLVEDYGFDPVAAGVVLAAVQTTGVGARIFWGVVADITRNSICTLLVLAAAIALLATAVPFVGEFAPVMIVPLLIALGATLNGWNGVFVAEVARLAPPGHVGEVTAVVLAGSYVGVFIVPALLSISMPWIGGYTQGYLIMAVGSFMALGFLCFARSSATYLRTKSSNPI